MLSDRLFKADYHNTLSFNAPTFCYYFKYQIENSKSIINNSGKTLGVAHGDDVFLIFNNRKLSEYNDEEKIIGRNFVEMYKNFATNGFPLFGGHKINAVDKNLQCLEIISGSNFSMISLEKSFGNFEFWDGLNIKE